MDPEKSKRETGKLAEKVIFELIGSPANAPADLFAAALSLGRQAVTAFPGRRRR